MSESLMVRNYAWGNSWKMSLVSNSVLTTDVTARGEMTITLWQCKGMAFRWKFYWLLLITSLLIWQFATSNFTSINFKLRSLGCISLVYELLGHSTVSFNFTVLLGHSTVSFYFAVFVTVTITIVLTKLHNLYLVGHSIVSIFIILPLLFMHLFGIS